MHKKVSCMQSPGNEREDAVAAHRRAEMCCLHRARAMELHTIGIFINKNLIERIKGMLCIDRATTTTTIMKCSILDSGKLRHGRWFK